jgi:hypothetical protein
MPITFLETVEKLLGALSTSSDLDKAKLALALLDSIVSPKVLTEHTFEWEVDHARRLLKNAIED